MPNICVFPGSAGSPSYYDDLDDFMDFLGLAEVTKSGKRFDIISKFPGTVLGTVHEVGNGLKATCRRFKNTCWVSCSAVQRQDCLRKLILWLHASQSVSLLEHERRSRDLRESFGMKLRPPAKK